MRKAKNLFDKRIFFASIFVKIYAAKSFTMDRHNEIGKKEAKKCRFKPNIRIKFCI